MNMDFEFDANDLLSQLNVKGKQVQQQGKQAMEDVTNELVRIASEIVAIDKGVLQKSHSEKFTVHRDGIDVEVEFSVLEKDFNYALWIHEGVYNHGEKTMKRPPTTGWSGKRYYAGRKYLERPLNGERESFINHIAKTIRKGVEGK